MRVLEASSSTPHHGLASAANAKSYTNTTRIVGLLVKDTQYIFLWGWNYKLLDWFVLRVPVAEGVCTRKAFA